ncbi:T9SS type A sorting domain-containing protein [Dyadobacter pollutisoli]|uniref:T9SS type A sorting domain-containing protein n=1 Tax=Dyadobacter pollutisoli TaxID=2910158 RepID=A0A9E8N970_9BACT|nr:T9SS type A sorting domain-containing protein [Dyadobacter pollutisoli]WAC10807.1 T9SS type A sorting domain-containing protein [Dyadobacter pollutisoli]
MEHTYNFRNTLLKISIAILFSLSSSLAQIVDNYQKQKQGQLSRLDLTGLGKMLLLNNGVISSHEIASFQSLSKSGHVPSQEPVTAEDWQSLYQRLIDTDLRPKNERLPDLNTLTETDPNKATKNNVVPIGILDLDGIYLTGKQIADNEQSKKNNQFVDFSTYEPVRIITASVLQEDVFEADILFRLNPSLYISNHDHSIQNLEIDFHDGKGYATYPLSAQLIPHHFSNLGKQKIDFRLTSGDKIFAFQTQVNVLQLERLKPFMEFEVNAPRIWTDTSSANFADKTARTALAGGNIRIILGCDNILNKPIIIAEGFDMGQNVNLDYLEAKYRDAFRDYLLEGYDLVLLDYTDARDAIQNNAQVLKALIQQVNQMKTGNNPSIVVGESMSGLVARWALREMENQGIPHQVNLMICYDTPHQGANVPVGMTQLYWETNVTVLTQVIFKFLAKGWRNYYEALNTPAAQQMLLHWGGSINTGVGNKSPFFDSFRAQLLALGNGGYPQSCRNIAVIHGSMNASDLSLFGQYNYGSRILLSFTPNFQNLQNANIDIHTNQLNQNESVLRYATWGLLASALGVNKKYNSALNDDFLPGGRTQAPIPNKFFGKNKTDFRFCFVPTFSSIDYQGPRNTQNERMLLNVWNVDAATVNRQTPFAAIYGRADGLNSTHVDTDFSGFDNIGQAEGLLANIVACPPLAPPPVPTIAPPFSICFPFAAKRTTEDNTANITMSLATPSNGMYVHNWTVLPANQYFTTTGDQITFQAERADHYDVTCTRTYPNRKDISSTYTVSVEVKDCSPQSIIAETIVNDNWEDDFVLTLANNDNVFAHYSTSDILYAATENGTFVPASALIARGMFQEFASFFAEIDPRIALPVHLVSFDVGAEGSKVILEWKTSEEMGSDHFEIEKSSDSRAWRSIGEVPAREYTSDNVYYSFTDPEPITGMVYYRLKMVDIDSTYAFSKIRNLQFDDEGEWAVFPNPLVTGESLSVLSGKQHEVNTISIYDLNGNLLRESCKPSKGLIEKDLLPGKYIVKIKLRDGTEKSLSFVKK